MIFCHWNSLQTARLTVSRGLGARTRRQPKPVEKVARVPARPTQKSEGNSLPSLEGTRVLPTGDPQRNSGTGTVRLQRASECMPNCVQTVENASKDELTAQPLLAQETCSFPVSALRALETGKFASLHPVRTF